MAQNDIEAVAVRGENGGSQVYLAVCLTDAEDACACNIRVDIIVFGYLCWCALPYL